MCGGVGVPSLWLADGLGQDTCFLEGGYIYTIGDDFVTKAKAPHYNKNKDRNMSVSATSFDKFIVSLTNDNAIDVFVMNDNVLSKGLSIGLVCPHCGEVSRDVTNFKKHVRNHDAAPVKCDRCNILFDKIVLRDHVKTCLYLCPWRDEGCEVTNKEYAKHKAHIRMHEKSLSN